MIRNGTYSEKVAGNVRAYAVRIPPTPSILHGVIFLPGYSKTKAINIVTFLSFNGTHYHVVYIYIYI